MAGLFKGGESEKPAIVAGKPDASPLYLAVTRLHEADNWTPMPPKEADKLTAEQVGWIHEGRVEADIDAAGAEGLPPHEAAPSLEIRPE